MTVSWDFKIGGRQYIRGAPSGIELGAALTEPARPSEVGNIVIASLHGGIGRGFTEGILRYSSAVQADLTIPGEFLPAYVPQAVGSPFTPSVNRMRPTFGYGNGAYATVYIIAGQTLKYFDPANPGGGLIDVTIAGDAWPANSEFSGSAFQYNGQLVMGIIDTTDADLGKPKGYVTVTAIETDNPGDATLEDSVDISYGASTRGRSFWVENDSNLKWAPHVAGASFKGPAPLYTEFPTGATTINLGYPRIVWLATVGSSLLYFRSDGVIIGGDETGMLSVAGQTPVAGLDLHFGRRAAPYHDGILVPARTGLWSFDLRSLTLRPASANYIQGEAIDRLRGEITAVGSSGPYGFFAIREVSSAGVVTARGYVLVRYANLIAVHDELPQTATNEIITDFLPFYDSTFGMTRLYYLVYNESTDTVTLKYLPLRLPPDQRRSSTFLSDDSYVALADLVGPSPASNMTKLFVQVRGHFDKGASGNAVLRFTNWTIDGQAVSLADVTTTGPFVREFTTTVGQEDNLVGRSLTTAEVHIIDAEWDTKVELPLTIDFVWSPGTQDSFVLTALLSSEVQGNVASLWHKAVNANEEFLMALRSTVTTLEFPHRGSWKVFVEGIQVDDLPAPDGDGQLARVAKVQMRRLT